MMSTPAPAPLPKTPDAPAPPPMFGMNQQQKKPKAQSTQPTFLGSGDIPQNNPGGKTLMGQ